MQAEVTIVIPAKNEVKMLPKLLASLCKQDYVGPNGEGMGQVRVLIADADSTDGTVEVALTFGDRLAIEVIPGGVTGSAWPGWPSTGTSRRVFPLAASLSTTRPPLVTATVSPPYPPA